MNDASGEKGDSDGYRAIHEHLVSMHDLFGISASEQILKGGDEDKDNGYRDKDRKHPVGNVINNFYNLIRRVDIGQ